MKKREIILKRGLAKEIAETLGCTPQIVYKALRWETNGKKSEAVRRLAITKMKEFNQ